MSSKKELETVCKVARRARTAPHVVLMSLLSSNLLTPAATPEKLIAESKPQDKT